MNLKIILTFLVSLFLMSGIMGSMLAGLVGASVITIVVYWFSQQSPSIDSAGVKTPNPFADIAPNPLEQRVSNLEKQVTQLKQQLLEAINTGLANPALATPKLTTTSYATLPVDTIAKTHVIVQAPEVTFSVSPEPVAKTATPFTTPLHETIAAPATPAQYSTPPRSDTPPPSSAPAKPSAIETLITSGVKAAKNWLTGGNTLVRVGTIILFFGVAFLLKFAADNDYVPIELRLLGVALLGMGLVGIGFKVRNTAGKTGFSYAMQGGGIGMLYLTIFAAFKLYNLIPQGLTFGLLAGIAFASAGLAVLQSALALAILGFAGGFAAPILISTGAGSHIGLFSYYLVLNLGIAFIAYFRDWRVLNVIGFAFTFVIGTLWGVQKYTPELFATTEPFLIAHGLIYTFIAIAYAFKRAPNAKDYVDATLVFGTPLVGFGLQYGLLKDSPMGMAYSALALGAYYMVLAWWIITRKRDTLKFLGECFLALAVGFATLAIPLSLDGRWTSASWALEGVALLWVGLKQTRFLPSATGLALQVLGAVMFVKGWGLTGSTATGGQNMFLGAAFIALSGLACGALLLRHTRQSKPKDEPVDTKTNVSSVNTMAQIDSPPSLSARLFESLSSFAPSLANAAALWGWAWLMLSGAKGISAWKGAELHNLAVYNPFMLYVVLVGLGLYILARKLQWPMLRTVSFAALPAMVGAAVVTAAPALLNDSHWEPPSNLLGWLCWPLAAAAYWAMLYRDKTALAAVQHPFAKGLGISSHWLWQSSLLWTVSTLSLIEINHWIDQKTNFNLAILLAIEGACIIWLGMRSVRWLPKALVNPWVMVLAGLALQCTAGLNYFGAPTFSNFDFSTFWHAAIIGSLIWISAYLIRDLNHTLSAVYTVMGWLAWVVAGLLGIEHLRTLKLFPFDALGDMHVLMVYLALLSIAVYWIGRCLAWQSLWALSFAVLPFIGIGVQAEGLNHTPLSGLGWLAWPSLLITLPLLLHWQGKLSTSNTGHRALTMPWAFATGWLWRAPWLWAVAWLAMRQAFDLCAQHAGGDWPVLAGLAASFVVVMVTMQVFAKSKDTVRSNWVVYACGPVLVCLLVYSVYATLNLAGDTPPLPYITLLNPLELGLLGIVLLAALWFKTLSSLNASDLNQNRGGVYHRLLPHTPKLLAGLGFVWLNSVLLRSLHHYAVVPYLWASVLDNTVARAAFTLLWSFTALALMLYAHKKAARTLWIIGAALMVVVVAKLFLLDLSGRGTVERIVSFMGAGLLLLVMGYFAPLPPAKTTAPPTAKAPDSSDTEAPDTPL